MEKLMIDDSSRWIGDVDQNRVQYLMFAKSLMSAMSSMSSMLSGALKAKEFQI